MAETMTIFRLLRYIRDARSTRKAERLVLNALAMRCNPSKKFLCWPSYALLASDTMLDIVTIKRIAKRLEDADLIKRVVRKNRSNLYFINAALLIQQASEKRAVPERGDDVPPSPFDDVTIDEDPAEETETYDDEGFGGAR